MKRLILITKSYPYNYGEEFLENEINSLAGRFDKITIFATAVQSVDRKRSTPDNVECSPMYISKKSLLPSAAESFLFAYKKPADDRDVKQAKKSMVCRAELAYFTAKSKKLYKRILSSLDSDGVLNDSDTVVIYSFWLYDTAAAAAMLKDALIKRARKGIGKSVRIKAVSRAHGYDLYEYRSPTGYIPLREYLLKNLDMIYPCSDDGTNYLQKRYDADNDKIKTAYLGVCDNGSASRLSDERFTVVSCAYVSPVKRIERLASALKLLPQDKKIKWVHLGGGEKLNEIKEFAAENLENIECEFYGSVKNSEIIEFYKNNQANLFVNTSLSEGLPVSIMEAQSFGIPAVATDVGGSSEIVKNGETGFLINRDFTDRELAEAITRVVYMDPQEYEKLRDNSRKNYLLFFSADNNYARFADEIANL